MEFFVSVDDGLAYSLHNTDELPVSLHARLHDCFESNYRDANHGYLDQSFKRLKRLAVAERSGRVVGFNISDTKVCSLPGLEGEYYLVLGGIGCIDPEYRRQKLFSRLAQMAGGDVEGDFVLHRRILACARIAHPASFRTINGIPGCIPALGREVSSRQLEIAAAVASIYGVKLKPGKMIVEGSGTPIGYPDVEFDVDDDEWLPFADVDRDRGDSILALAWTPDAPDGWSETSDQ